MDEWRKDVETEFGKDVFQTGFSGAVVSSGSFIVDFLTSVGGFPLGGIVEIFGEEGSGKTTLALSCLKQAMDEGRSVLWLDFERTLNHSYLKKIGFTDAHLAKIKNYLLSPTSLEDGFMMMRRFCELKENHGGVIGVDSVAAMPPVADIAKMNEIIGHVRVASMAQVMSVTFNQMTQVFKKANVCAIFLNQERSNIDTTGRSIGQKTTPGGAALKFYSSQRIKLESRGAVKIKVDDAILGGSQDRVIAVEIGVTALKNKLGPSFRKSRMFLRMDEGIDNLTSALKIAEMLGWITKKGAGHYTIRQRYSGEIMGEAKEHGFERVRQFFITRPEETVRLLGDVKEYLKNKLIEKESTDESGTD